MSKPSAPKFPDPKIQFSPDQFSRSLLAWYNENHRRLPWRQNRDPYFIWVSEVMLQQTRVDTVLSYYKRFLERFPSLEDLAGADLQDVLKIWEGLGYYARARNFHAACKMVLQKHDGQIPNDPDQFRSLPGVGDYIAAAVMSLAFDRPMAVVDGNVKRVLARLLLMDAPVNLSKSHGVFGSAARQLMDKNRPGKFNQAIMELGALVCTPRGPACGGCPVSGFCRAFFEHQVLAFPKRTPPPVRPVRRTAAACVMNNESVLARLRPEKGLLGGMWELPGKELEPGENPMKACKNHLTSNLGLAISDVKHIGVVRHGYTHFRLEAHVFACRTPAKAHGDALKWIHRARLKEYPFHVAARKMLALALK